MTLTDITFLSVSSGFLLPFTLSYIGLECFSFCVVCQSRSCCNVINYKVKYSLLLWRHLTLELLSTVLPIYLSFYPDSYFHFDTWRSHLAECFFLRSVFCHVLHVLEHVSLFSFPQLPNEKHQLSTIKYTRVPSKRIFIHWNFPPLSFPWLWLPTVPVRVYFPLTSAVPRTYSHIKVHLVQ